MNKSGFLSSLSREKRNLLLTVALAGAGVLILLLCGGQDRADGVEDETAAMSSLEIRVRELIEAVDGVDDVHVLLTCCGDEVRGVAVVCSGGDRAHVKSMICELLSCALGIPISKISVAGTG